MIDEILFIINDKATVVQPKIEMNGEELIYFLQQS